MLLKWPEYSSSIPRFYSPTSSKSVRMLMSLITNTIDHTQGTVHHVGMGLKKKNYFTYQGSFPKARKLLKHSLADQKSIYPSARNHFSLFSNLLNIIWYNWCYATVFVARSSYHWPGFLVDIRKPRKSVIFFSALVSLLFEWKIVCKSYEIKCFCAVVSYNTS